MKTTGIPCAILALFLMGILLFVYHNGGMSTGLFVSLSCSAFNLTSLLLYVLAEQFRGLSYVDRRLSDLTGYFAFEEVCEPSV